VALPEPPPGTIERGDGGIAMLSRHGDRGLKAAPVRDPD
jgi:hypothetical protein